MTYHPSGVVTLVVTMTVLLTVTLTLWFVVPSCSRITGPTGTNATVPDVLPLPQLLLPLLVLLLPLLLLLLLPFCCVADPDVPGGTMNL
jgi:hypothetical protein